MSRTLRHAVRGALPPHRIAPLLPPGGHLACLDALAPGGWGTGVGGRGPGQSLLAWRPEALFCGGLEALDDARRWLDPGPSRRPLEAVLVGFLSYDLGRSFERLPDLGRPGPPLPDVWMAGFRAVYRYSARRGLGAVVGSDPRALGELREALQAVCAEGPSPLPPPPAMSAPTSPLDDAAFRRGVRRIQEWIRAGDVYQVNLTRRLDHRAARELEPRALHALLCARTGAPFSACLECGEDTLLSNSPERFLRVVGRAVETCPIKGTRPRGATPEEDRWLRKDLRSSPKDLAEHRMIVDLERNDLGRVCEIGSVRVPRLARLQVLPTVHHLVSSVVGVLRRPEDWRGLLAATFPGGSVTGAPKLRAMQIIEALEPVRRGFYTGALGILDARGGFDWSLAIRTARVHGRGLELHVGGGIVADSDPEAELAETHDKARAFTSLWSPPG